MSVTNTGKRIGIVAHSAEGAALCFITACREGQRVLGPHVHPEIVLSAIPMGASLPGWESGDHDVVARELRRGVEQVAAAGADFFICPDNTAHIVFERIASDLPIPGLHIAEVVCREMQAGGWSAAALLGTRWTMTGPVYPQAMRRRGLRPLVPGEERRERINHAIFDELCQGKFESATTEMFLDSIRELAAQGAECVILGCTEIPLVVDDRNSSLPVLDSTRLLATYAVREALNGKPLRSAGGWVVVGRPAVESGPVEPRQEGSMSEITSSTFVLAVNDLDASRAFYCEKLGFSEELRVGGWSFLRRGACKLRLGHCADARPMSECQDHSWFAYLHVRDASGLYRECLKHGVEIWHQLADKPWGMREFAIVTPDGHRIVFGEEIK